LNKGHSVTSLDNFFTGSKDNISHLESNPRFNSIEHDIIEPFDIDVEAIFNMACPASPIKYQLNPVQTLRTSVHGAINILELARKTGARVLQASTSEIYGDPAISPQNEEYWGNVNPIGIRSCYDEGKRAAETLFFDYHRQYSVDIRVARIFNTYGPRMAKFDGRVVSNFVVQALQGENLTVYGDGMQIRSLCYVDDLIAGIEQLMLTEDVYEPINIGNPEPLTMLDLAKEIIALTNSKSNIVFENLPSDDPLTREPDISKARSILGWNPKVSRIEGLERTIQHFSSILKIQ
jgi:UDP-glucuronate decarboxylase